MVFQTRGHAIHVKPFQGVSPVCIEWGWLVTPQEPENCLPVSACATPLRRIRWVQSGDRCHSSPGRGAMDWTPLPLEMELEYLPGPEQPGCRSRRAGANDPDMKVLVTCTVIKMTCNSHHSPMDLGDGEVGEDGQVRVWVSDASYVPNLSSLNRVPVLPARFRGVRVRCFLIRSTPLGSVRFRRCSNAV